jgi:hypothetical protein
MTATTTIRSGPRRVTVTDVLSITWVWPAPAEGHHCHAKNCPLSCPPERLCCRRHWFMAPKVLRDAVWRHYREGQCDDKNPSEAWHEAADKHLAAVWARELESITTLERALELAWPASANPLAWENFKSVAQRLFETGGKALWMDLGVVMDQKQRTIVITLKARAAVQSRLSKQDRRGFQLG